MRGRSVVQGPGANRRGPAVTLLALVLVLVAAAVAWAGQPVKGGMYSGLNAERIQTTVKVSSNGKKVQSFSSGLGYNGKCGQGGGPGFVVKASNVQIQGGKFSKTVKATFFNPAVPTPTVKITGSFTGRKVKGTITSLTTPKCSNGKQPYATTYSISAP